MNVYEKKRYRCNLFYQQNKVNLVEEEDEEDLRCGYGNCKPSWLQIFNNPKMFLVWLCCFAFIQGE